MSHFHCEHCGAEILEGPGGHCITECPHYPMEPYGKQRACSRAQGLMDKEPRRYPWPIDEHEDD